LPYAVTSEQKQRDTRNNALDELGFANFSSVASLLNLPVLKEAITLLRTAKQQDLSSLTARGGGLPGFNYNNRARV
jgi:hypothetical protein